MIAWLYDQNHVLIGLLKDMKGAEITTDLSNGDKTLSFSIHQKNRCQILPEYYIATETDEYVVKQNDASGSGFRKITAVLNLEELEGKPWEKFLVQEGTAKEIIDYAITGTGWQCVSTVAQAKKRNISMTKSSTLDIIAKVREAFICESWFDTLKKIVYLAEKKGADKGAYFIRGLNLKELEDGCSSYDYITRLVPYGADGLMISGVEPEGKTYVENYQYSQKKKARIWEDTSYTDAGELYEAAKHYLEELSRPQKSYQAKIIDLAKIKPEYSILEYAAGDTITLIDGEKGVREKQRIIKTVEYPDTPEKNTCDISNTVLSFEDMQKQLQAAAECVGNITTDNGTIRGSTVDAIDVTQIIGLDRYISENMDELTVKNLYVTEKLGAVDAAIGHAEFTQADITALNVKADAEIVWEHVTESHIDTLYAGYAKFDVLESDNIAAMAARILELESREITVDYLDAHFANINFSNVEKETVGTMLADVGLITNATIVDGHVTGYLDSVSINANDIKAGTLSVDRLIINGTTDSIIYALNNAGELESTHCDTLDGGILTKRTVTADRLVAESITANEIASGTITTDRLNVNDIFADNAVITTITSQSAFINAIATNSVVVGAASAADAANSVISKWCYNNDVTFIDGGKLYTGSVTAEKIAAKAITADKINVTDLYALGAKIGGFTIGVSAIYNGTNSLTSNTAGVYLGTDGLRTASNSGYVNISNGKVISYVGNDTAYADASFELVSEGAGKKGATYISGFRIRFQDSESERIYSELSSTSFKMNTTAFGGHYTTIYADAIGTTGTLNIGGATTLGGPTTLNSPYLYMNGFNSTFDSVQIRASGNAGNNSFSVIAYDGNTALYWLDLIRADGSSVFPGDVRIGTSSNSKNLTTYGAINCYTFTTQHCYTYAVSNGGNTNFGSNLYHAIVTAPGTGNRSCSYINTNAANSNGIYYLTVNGQWGASGYASHNITSASSDIRLKTNVSDTDEYALSTISKMQVRQFDWKESGEHQKIGFVADELEAIDSRLAFGGGYEEDGSMNVKSVDTFYMMGYVVKGMQEIALWKNEKDVQIQTMQNQIFELQIEKELLKNEVAKLKQMVS